MFNYSLSDYHWFYILVIAFLVLFSFIFRIIIRKKKYKPVVNKHILYFFLVAVAFSFFGLTVGLLVGLSISPVIGVVVPALLTFFGGFITYVFIFGKKTEEEGYLMTIIMISLSFFLILGSDYGSAMRIAYEKKKNEFEYWKQKDFEIFKRNLERDNHKYQTPTSKSNESEIEIGVDTVAKTGIKKL